jgi:hypothetical protein
MLANLGATFHEFSEFLIMQMLFSEGNDMAEEMAGAIVAPVIEEEVKARGEFYNALVDKRMLALFMLFDLGTFAIVAVLANKEKVETIVFLTTLFQQTTTARFNLLRWRLDCTSLRATWRILLLLQSDVS